MSTARYFDWPWGSVEVDPSTQVLELEVAQEEAFYAMVGRRDLERVPVNPADPSMGAVYAIPASIGPRLYARLSEVSNHAPIMWAPAQAFAVKARAFDDGLLATVANLVQGGTPRLPGKRGLVEDLWQALRARWPQESSSGLRETLSFLQAALSMTGHHEESSRTLSQHAKRWRQDFEADASRSTPTGVHAWTDAARALFKQDRLLQEELAPESAELLAWALGEDPSRRALYQRHLAFIARLTNPSSKPAVHEVGAKRCVLPPSDSHAGRLVQALLGEVPPPLESEVIEEVLQRIRDGRLDTTPGPDSGLHDHQLHTLAPLLFPERTPESERLVVGPRYRAELEAQFRGFLVQPRQPQLKPVEVPAHQERGREAQVSITVPPRLTLEPLAEHYRRRADTYRFLRHMLDEFLGADRLNQERRTLVEGTSHEPLFDELVWMEQLFRGAHAIVRRELGCAPIPDADVPAAMLTRKWLHAWRDDVDLGTDTRRVVPLAFDQARERTRVVAMMGFLSTSVEARFLQPPQVRAFSGKGHPRAAPTPSYPSIKYQTLCPVAEEVYVRRVPEPDEFRRLCDTYVSREAILRALQE
ncbi:hypothetical protein LZ198_04470 [Myxococcus sp. K15C18031901]|uniref:hypothetical protein n=1 Tax=Myxococcus dinghuensis TaxID=2906761 RepID=UPI0020A6F4C3|nr:hypothetical protein [Myxococcus dinghuensis]MCP3098130.1 hypothetical protein [Myxococcus dinghuensis]